MATTGVKGVQGSMRFRICDLPKIEGKAFRGAFTLKPLDGLKGMVRLREGMTLEEACSKVGVPSVAHLRYLGVYETQLDVDRLRDVAKFISHSSKEGTFATEDDRFGPEEFRGLEKGGEVLKPKLRDLDWRKNSRDLFKSIVVGRLCAESDAFEPFNICDAFSSGISNEKGMQIVTMGYDGECGMLAAAYVKRLGITDPYLVGWAIMKPAKYQHSTYFSTARYLANAISWLYPDITGTDKEAALRTMVGAVSAGDGSYIEDNKRALINGIIKSLAKENSVPLITDARRLRMEWRMEQARLSDDETELLKDVRDAKDLKGKADLIAEAYNRLPKGTDKDQWVARIVEGMKQSASGTRIDLINAIAARIGVEPEAIIRHFLVTEISYGNQV